MITSKKPQCEMLDRERLVIAAPPDHAPTALPPILGHSFFHSSIDLPTALDGSV
jgi:hypothetical protein